MKTKDALKIAVKVLKELPADRSFKSVSGQKATAAEASQSIQRLIKWAYEDLDSGDMELVVHCKNCQNYKRYKKKGVFKPEIIKMCSLDKIKRDPEFFCKSGVRK